MEDIGSSQAYLLNFLQNAGHEKRVWWNLWVCLLFVVFYDTQSDVYSILGYVHEFPGNPCQIALNAILPTSMSDGYQSIHMIVCGWKWPIEFLLLVKVMDEVVEYWVAAQFAYKNGIKWQVKSNDSAIGMYCIKEMMQFQDFCS